MPQEFEFIKNEKTKIKIQVNEYKGKTYMHFREWFLNEGGEWCPSKKGFALSEDFGLEFIKGAYGHFFGGR